MTILYRLKNRAVLLIVATLFSGTNTFAQYTPPLDCALDLSANYAEVRTNRYHLGIDIRTKQREGLIVRAVADGYISRIGIAPYGYGKAIYITHPNGKTSVYAHLKRFNPEVEEYVNGERYKGKKHSFNIFTPANKFPVKAGDQIALSGNTGMSFGPHLHFEIRETATQKTLNPVPICNFDIPDDVAPKFVKVMYVATDTIKGVPIHSKPKNILLTKLPNNIYEPTSKSPIEVSRHGYFIAQVSDAKNGTGNLNMSVYKIIQKFNDTVNFEITSDAITFANSRYAGSATHYVTQQATKHDTYILSKKQGNNLPIYSNIRNNGIISLNQGESGSIDMEIIDESGNKSYLAMSIIGGRKFEPAKPAQSILIAHYNKTFHYSANGATVSIPKGTLFESIFYHQKMSTRIETPVTTKRFSPIYDIHRPDVSLFSYYNLSINADSVPQHLRSKAMIAYRSSKGRWSSAGGVYKDGEISARVRSFGQYCIVTDTVPPKIKPSFIKGANLRNSSNISFAISDNFAGIATFNATIDGEWILFEHNAVKRKITHYFNDAISPKKGVKYNLSIEVTDGKGNKKVIDTWFTR